MFDGLNARQREAATHQDGNLLIVAGPGTGKTHTLVARICRLASTTSSFEKILAITFTNKAAGELAARLHQQKIDPSRYQTATFHAFALGLLRQYYDRLEFPLNFTVLTPGDVEILTEELWPHMRPKERRDRLEKVSAWKATLAVTSDDPLVEEYRRFLRAKASVDFDDVLRDAVFLLRDNLEVLREVHAVYRHILVDEYQDMNPVQEALLKLLAAGARHVTAIGDPNQAIYGFRGSDVALLHRFAREFPPCTVLSLEENYRSPENLLLAGTQVMAKGEDVAAPALVATIKTPGFLTEYEAPTDRAEAVYVAREIEKLLGGTAMRGAQDGENFSFADIAVLYRLNAQARLLTEALDASGVPYRVSNQKAEPGGTEDIYLPRAEKVSLMTLHAAKGLEFPVVFIVGCEQGLIPLDMDIFTCRPAEERCLFYVGMTRARQRLYLVRAKKRFLLGKELSGIPSPFLSDIAAALKVHEKAPKFRHRPDQDQMRLF